MAGLPLFTDRLTHDLHDADAECGEAVQDGNTNLKVEDLTVEVARQKALTQQFHTVHFVSARLRLWYANNLGRIKTIRSDAKIDGADPANAALTGKVEVRFADTTLLTQAINGTAGALEFSYAWAPAKA